MVLRMVPPIPVLLNNNENINPPKFLIIFDILNLLPEKQCMHPKWPSRFLAWSNSMVDLVTLSRSLSKISKSEANSATRPQFRPGLREVPGFRRARKGQGDC